jgi:hypothetical protein
VKLLGSISLVLLSGLWAIFWCAQLSDLSLTDYSVVFVLVASLALIPVFWATSLINRAWRRPLSLLPQQSGLSRCGCRSHR